jgi:uncharacterized protein with HEPN domain
MPPTKLKKSSLSKNKKKVFAIEEPNSNGVEVLRCVNNKRVKFLPDANIADYQTAINNQIQAELAKMNSEEYSEIAMDRMYQNMASILINRTMKLQEEGYAPENQKAFSLIEQYKHHDLNYQHNHLKLRESPLDSVWKPVNNPIVQWNQSILNKLNAERKHTQMAFVTSITHVGEHMKEVLNAMCSEYPEVHFCNLFMRTEMLTDNALYSLLHSIGDNGLKAHIDTIKEVTTYKWTQQFNMFFTLDNVMLKKHLHHIHLPKKLLKLRWLVLTELDRLSLPDIRAKAISVAYDFLWQKLYSMHWCTRFQLMIYVARVAAFPLDDEIPTLQTYFHIQRILSRQ